MSSASGEGGVPPNWLLIRPLEKSTLPSQKNTSNPRAPGPRAAACLRGTIFPRLNARSGPSPSPWMPIAFGSPSAEENASKWQVPQAIRPFRLTFWLRKNVRPTVAKCESVSSNS